MLKQMRDSKKKVQGLVDLCDCLPRGIIGLEIGSFAGESANIFMESKKFNKLYCVDPWNSKQWEDHKVEERFDNVVSKHAGVIKCKGKLGDFIQDIDRVDFVYIDGNHKYLFVLKDIFQALTVLKIPGYIAGHDYKIKKYCGVGAAVRTVFPYDKIKTFSDRSYLICLKSDPLLR